MFFDGRKKKPKTTTKMMHVKKTRRKFLLWHKEKIAKKGASEKVFYVEAKILKKYQIRN